MELYNMYVICSVDTIMYKYYNILNVHNIYIPFGVPRQLNISIHENYGRL